MNARPFKDAVYKQFARIGKCLSSEKRLELLHLLSQGSKSVERLAQQTGMSIANVSQHLQVLAEARLVTSRKKGTFVYYELADGTVTDLLLSLWRTGERQLADIHQIKADFMNTEEGFLTIPLDEALDKLEKGEIVLIDVRPADEYEHDHIPGAISVPIEELADFMRGLPNDRDVVAYCRGPYCAYAAQAVTEFRSQGFQAFRLEEGVHEWRAYGSRPH